MKVWMLFAALMMAVTETKAQSDFGLWMNVSFEKELDDQWALRGSAEARSRNNMQEMDRYNVGVEALYKPIKYLKLAAGYDLLYDHRGGTETYNDDGTISEIIPLYWWPRHSLHFGITGSYSIGDLKLSLRELYQFNYRAKAEGKNYNTYTDKWEDALDGVWHTVRTRVGLDYNIEYTPLKPFANVEVYHEDLSSISKVRYTIGTNITVGDQRELSIYYRYQDIRKGNSVNNHVLGIGYAYKF